MVLQGTNQQQVIRDTLLPYSEIPVPVGTETPGTVGTETPGTVGTETTVSPQQPEVCQSLITATQLYPLCQPVGNCTGLMCQLQNGLFSGSVASFQVRKCQDPVVVELLITSSDGMVGFQREFSGSRTVYDGTQLVKVQVTMARNATYLNFSVSCHTFYHMNDINFRCGTSVCSCRKNQAFLPLHHHILPSLQALTILPSVQLIPLTSVPLNTTECMCESLEDLADIIQSPFEHDCSTTPNCDGVHCELDIFGLILYIETIVLPCANPPALEVIVQNSQRQNIFGAIFNTSGQRDIVVLNTRMTVNSIIVHRSYSMDIEVSELREKQ